MDLMGFGAFELLVVMVLALLVLGPKRLASTARTAGKMVREMRQLGNEFSRALLDETEEKDASDSKKPGG